MKRRMRIYYTTEQKAVIQNRYNQGDCLHDIDKMFDRYPTSIMPTIFSGRRVSSPNPNRPPAVSFA